ncbi:uncharacterized protein LOC109860892 [Pseudomyrmex gracilis]|uniref:uncharacterized protein LOC109860892 n=1 Tax=Pseudomyrmex gracilis TaxID=219809 RepID=UPI0009955717|nr:uncharacterized protein LOC109860892 [Pseudomyrmex gracilis]XP_020295904.1 uncharacterized protein LOC109860892 [Pseudomyrmex gracilis]
MRIEALSTLVAVVWLTAVLCPRLTAANNLTEFLSRRPREHSFKGHISRWEEVPTLEETANKRMTYREMQALLRQESGDDGFPVECCPTKTEMVEPVGGRNQQNMYVQLYRHGQNVQRFFEKSCREDVLNKPCRFIDRKFSNQSRCVQKFMYMYAIVETPGSKVEVEEHRRHHHREHHRLTEFPPNNTVSGSGWALDYIEVRTGCSCEITPKPRKKKVTATKARKAKSKQRHAKDQEFET